MTQPPTDGPPAGLQLLDPNPPPPTRGPHWERILGLLLVLGIAAAGGWQWISAEGQHSAYRTAVQAETAQDWDRALTAYGHAGDYNDSAIRRANVAAIIHERDTAYATASSAFQRQDWAALLPALLPLQRLAPTYRDMPRFVAARETAVYTPALSGTVALRLSAQPPGLYTYRNGWHWLTDSDPQSQIETRCPNGDWLLDVPLPAPPGAKPLPTPPADASDRERLAGRRFALVTADGAPHTLLDPALNGWNYRSCDNQRVWGVRQAQIPAVSSAFPSLALTATWQLFDQAMLHAPALPSPGWVLGYPSPDGQTLLVLNLTHFDAAKPQMSLFLADTDGSHLRPLVEFPGLLESNVFSPDGRSLMLKIQQPLPAGPDAAAPASQIRILWIMPTDPDPPRSVAQITLAPERFAFNAPLDASFLKQAPYAGWLFVRKSDASGDTVDLVTPDPTVARQTYTLPSDLYGGFYPTAADGTGRLLLPFTSRASHDIGGGTDTIGILNLPAGLTRFQPPLSAKDLRFMVLRGDRLIYEVSPRYYGAQEPITEEIYSVPLAQVAQPGVQPTLVFSNTSRHNDRAGSSTYFGQDWLTYITAAGELHARRYDGSSDVLLDRGFTNFATTYPSTDEP